MPAPQAVRIESMDLSAEEVGRLIEQIGGELLDGWDRRKHSRIRDRRIAVFVKIEGDGESSALFMLAENVSCGGLAFRHAGSLTLGTRFQAKLVPIGGSPILTAGRVVRCRSVDGVNHE